MNSFLDYRNLPLAIVLEAIFIVPLLRGLDCSSRDMFLVALVDPLSRDSNGTFFEMKGSFLNFLITDSPLLFITLVGSPS